jgi:dCMP deaminase
MSSRLMCPHGYIDHDCAEMRLMRNQQPDFRSTESEVVTAYERLERHDLYMEAARLYARRSSCRRAHVGAVAVREGRIVAAGYNGAPASQPDCYEADCIMLDSHCVRAVHAEANLIAWSARTGTPLLGTELYCTHAPCISCAKLILNAGVLFVTWENSYAGHGLNFLKGINRQHTWGAYAP